jgi:N-acetylneuraminic acid mutarotase
MIMRTVLFFNALLWVLFPCYKSYSQGTWTDVIGTGDDPISRTETSFVQSGNRFYLIGGRGINKSVIEFNYNTNTWTEKAGMPANLHHFQAAELDGLIYVVGAFGGNFPNEFPVTNIYIYDPVEDSWMTGPEIPASRRRGSGGTAVYEGKIYWIGGLINGHSGGWVKWVDVFDPKTNTWTQLTDAPRERDHFQAVVIGDEIYAASGRKTGAGASAYDSTIAEVDVYDIMTDTWSTLPPSGNIPFECAGALSVNLNGNVVVMGGEEANSTDALLKVQVLDVSTGTWTTANDMHRARHGSQAIVNNDRIYMAAGSRQRGGALLQSSDSNFFIQGDFTGSAPSGTANNPSDLGAKTGSINFPTTETGNSSTAGEKVISNNGNQAIIITNLSITGAGSSQFSLNFPFNLPVILAPGDSIEIPVDFNPSATGAHSATLEIEHSGNNTTVQVSLSGMGGSAPAPVELVDFNVTAEGENALLEWTTASELNNDFFSVERSGDGHNYATIGQIPGQGTSDEINEYRFSDGQPLNGTSYYRLKQVDFDGSFSYSSVQEFYFINETIDIYPNPIGPDGVLFLELTFNRQKEIHVNMIDITGRSVYESTLTTRRGQDLKSLSVPVLPKGIYWVKITSNEGRLAQKMITVQ